MVALAHVGGTKLDLVGVRGVGRGCGRGDDRVPLAQCDDSDASCGAAFRSPTNYASGGLHPSKRLTAFRLLPSPHFKS